MYAFGVCIGDDVFTKRGPPIMNLVWMFEITQHTEVVHCVCIYISSVGFVVCIYHGHCCITTLFFVMYLGYHTCSAAYI